MALASGRFASLCHPDDLSNARGGMDLGQLRVSAAGSGFEDRAALLCLESSDLETGTGGANAPLSEILPAARVARFVRMTETPLALLASSG